MKDFEKMIDRATENTDGKETDIEKAYKLGIRIGIKMMENKIKRQCELGKPILANGELYFLKNSREHLQDVMDSLDAVGK